MSVRVQCPHCSSVCQVEEQHLGSALKCGKCGQTFTVRLPLPEPAAPASGMGGIKAALRGVFRSLVPSRPETAEPVPAAPATDEPEDEVFLDLDGPAMAALPARSPSEPAPAPGSYRLDIAGATSVGRVRSRNEDSFLIQQLGWSNLDERHDAALVIVADGMGGHAAGDQASGQLIRSAGTFLNSLFAAALNGQLDERHSPAGRARAVADALNIANQAIYQKSQNDPACRGMGTTAALALVWDGQVAVGHIGDCRVYHQGAEQLTQVTRDQTLVARLVEMGQLTAEEAQRHPSRNEVLQAVGRHLDLEPGACEIALKPGDWLVVACDGLHAHVDRTALQRAIWEATSAAQLANRLVEMANEGGGTDNCTVVAIRCY